MPSHRFSRIARRRPPITPRRRAQLAAWVLAAALAGAVCGTPHQVAAAPEQSSAVARFKVKNYGAAREVLTQILAEKPEDKAALGLDGWCLVLLEDYAGAEQRFRKLLAISEKSFDGNLGMAWVGLSLGKLDEVEPYTQKAQSAAEDWQRPLVADARGWLAFKRGDLDKAEKLFESEDGLAVDGQDWPEGEQVGLGWVYLTRGDLDRAKKHFQRGLDRKKECFSCNDGLARVALAKGDKEEALKQTLAGLTTVGANNGLQSLLGSVLAALNDPAKSQATYQQLIAKQPQNAAFPAGLGYALLAAGKPEEAEKQFRQALAIDANQPTARAGLGEMQYFKTAIVKEGWQAYYRGDYEAALRSFTDKKPQAAAAKNPAAEDGRGWALLALGRAKEAREAFRAAIAIDPAFFYAKSGVIAAERAMMTLYGQAWSLIDLGRFDDATGMLRRAEAETPEDLKWLIADARGWISYYRKDYAGAERTFRAVLAGNADAYLSKTGLGMIALSRKEFGEAAQQITASLVANPYQALASYTVPARQLLDGGQIQAAKEILDLGTRIYPYSADLAFLSARAFKALRDDKQAAQRVVAAASLAPAYINAVFDEVQLQPQEVKDGYLALGWGLYSAGAYADALKRFDQYLAAGGTAETAQTGKGWTLLGLKKAEEAEASFRKAKAENADAQAGIGWARLQRNDIAGAEQSFRAALKLAANYIPATTGLGQVQYRKTELVKEGWERYFAGKYQEALKAFESKQSAAAAAKNPAAEDGRGWALLALGDHKAALGAFKAALAIDPGFFYSESGRVAAEQAGYTLYNAAWSQSFAGKFDEAAANFAKARGEIAPEFQWLVDDGLAWIAYYKKDLDGAETAFKAILAKNPNAYLSRKGLAYVAIDRKDYDGGVKQLVQSVVQAPYQIVRTYGLPAAKLIEAGEFTKARQVLELGEKVYPYSSDIQFLMAKVFHGTHDDQSAGKRLAAAAALAPAYINPVFDEVKLAPTDRKQALASLAWSLYFAGDNAAAVHRFDDAAKAGYDDPNGARGKGFALYRAGNFKEALPLLEAAAKLEPKPLRPIVETVPIPGTGSYWTVEYSSVSMAAWAQYRLGNAPRAEQLFRQTLDEHPFWIDALTGMGYAKLAKKDKAGATQFFTEALKISPAYPDALRGLAMVKANATADSDASPATQSTKGKS